MSRWQALILCTRNGREKVAHLLHSVSSEEFESSDEPFQIPIERELDLHTFKPRDIGELLPAYLAACREKGIFQVRVVHGKGIGNLRRTVHAILSRLSEVESYSLASEQFGGWGATFVNLRPALEGQQKDVEKE